MYYFNCNKTFHWLLTRKESVYKKNFLLLQQFQNFVTCCSCVLKIFPERQNFLHLSLQMRRKLDLMFMKHYAPNRCLYINVAKLITGVGSAQTSNLQKLQCQPIQRALQSPNLQRENIREKNNKLFNKFSPINLLIILYQLTKFEAPSCYSFGDIMNTNVQSPNLQREIIKKTTKKHTFFLLFTNQFPHHPLSADQA